MFATRRLMPWVGAAVLAWLSGAGDGRDVAVSNSFPAKDAIGNVEGWIQAHPKDAAAYRALGRVHALGWAYGESIPLVSAGGANVLPSFSDSSTVRVTRSGPSEPILPLMKVLDRQERAVTATEVRHLSDSIAAYRKAIELDPKDALSELGLAWVLAQQGKYVRELPAAYFGDTQATAAEKADWARAVGRLGDDDPRVREAASTALLAAMPRCVVLLRDVKTDDPEAQARIAAVLHGHFDLQALDHYRRAFELRAQEDLKGESTNDADSQISAEAGGEILAILARHPASARTDEVNSVRDVLVPLDQKREAHSALPQFSFRDMDE